MQTKPNSMILERLRLYGFRPYSEQLFEPQPGVNILHGHNGAGKTAILEAITMLSSARSFRAKREQEVVKWGNSNCQIQGLFKTDKEHSRELSLSWVRSEGEWTKTATFQNDKLQRLSDFLGCVPLSLFTPSDLDLISGSPSVRRKYLDLQLSKMHPLHLQDLSKLKKVISSRNALLRQGRPKNEVSPWNKLLYDLSVKVGQRREDLVTSLSPACLEFHESLTERQLNLQLSYKRCWPEDWDEFSIRLEELFEREQQRGMSLMSPQKDDLEIQTEGRSMRVYGSQGQQRTLALCLRLAEARQLSSNKNEGALLLLDDAFSELDSQRRERLLALLPQFSQVFITTSDDRSDFTPTAHQVSINEGQIV